ncbi:MAG: N-acetyltransferase [Candidatus Aenigmarchaeota archaeon]|nr:N-acetyltransferase [Candidatus Aenigmarchaeota archaeon]
MVIRNAKVCDVPEIHKLVNSFADRGEMLHRPFSEIYENLRDFFVVRKDGEIIGCCALHLFWSDLAEIRALAVKERYQNNGWGSSLVNACIKEAKRLSVTNIFCLTYKPAFFKRFGFKVIDRMKLPRKIWGECQRCYKFPNCNETAMILRLTKNPGKNKS